MTSIKKHSSLPKFNLLTFLLFTFSLLLFSLTSCDLINAVNDPDYFELIDEEIAWANAEKLTVHLSYNPDWGNSNPGLGQITPKIDIRQGYDFIIEFLPGEAFSLTDWRVFKGTLPESWTEDIGKFEDDIRAGKITQLEEGRDYYIMTQSSQRGGYTTLRIITTGTFTIVPWCLTEPRVLRTEPRIVGTDTKLPRGQIINIYFNSQLKESAVDKIKIRNTTDKADYESRYTIEYFDIAGQHVIVITPNKENLPQANKKIELMIETGETGIESTLGDIISGKNISYQWTTIDEANIEITKWGATYNSDGTITVDNWIATGDGSVEVTYSVNKGVRSPLANDRIIRGVRSIDDTGVREGRTVGNIDEYQINIDVYAGNMIAQNKTFRIWNIPGMSVSNANPLIEITSATGDNDDTDGTISLAEIPGNSTKQYVLAGDFTRSSHTPIANFKGNFYGNGHTIAIKGMNAAEDMGLFGVVDGGLVRDLTVAYAKDGNLANTVAANAVDIPAGADQFGGIAGTASDTGFENVLVKGAVNRGGVIINIGGIAGQTDEADIKNAYGGLAISVTDVTNMGGIIGEMSGGTIEDVYVTGNITATAAETWNMSIGGLLGFMNDGTLTKSRYHGGIISITIEGGRNQYLGGAVGQSSGNRTITHCAALPTEFVIVKNAGGGGLNFPVGGFAGMPLGSGKIQYCYSDTEVVVNVSTGADPVTDAGGFAGIFNGEISYCYAKGDVSIISYNSSFVAGGFIAQLGYSSSGPAAIITNCYATGNIFTIYRRNTRTPQASGFVGSNNYAPSSKIEDCYATGDVFQDSTAADAIYSNLAGGIIASSATGTTVNRCFYTGDIKVQGSNSNPKIIVGGIMGDALTRTITNSAVLSNNITVTGPGSNQAGRIFGDGTTGKSNNYAYNGMKMYASSAYADADPPYTVIPDTIDDDDEPDTPEIPNPDLGATKKHGASAGFGVFRDRRFWNGTGDVVLTNGVYTSGGLGFTSANWDFSTVEARGYPVLKAEDGSRLGGQ